MTGLNEAVLRYTLTISFKRALTPSLLSDRNLYRGPDIAGKHARAWSPLSEVRKLICETDSYYCSGLSSSAIPSFSARFSLRCLLRFMTKATVNAVTQTTTKKAAIMPIMGPGPKSSGFSVARYRTRSLTVSDIATEAFEPLSDYGGSLSTRKSKQLCRFLTYR